MKRAREDLEDLGSIRFMSMPSEIHHMLYQYLSYEWFKLITINHTFCQLIKSNNRYEDFMKIVRAYRPDTRADIGEWMIVKTEIHANPYRKTRPIFQSIFLKHNTLNGFNEFIKNALFYSSEKRSWEILNRHRHVKGYMYVLGLIYGRCRYQTSDEAIDYLISEQAIGSNTNLSQSAVSNSYFDDITLINEIWIVPNISNVLYMIFVVSTDDYDIVDDGPISDEFEQRIVQAIMILTKYQQLTNVSIDQLLNIILMMFDWTCEQFGPWKMCKILAMIYLRISRKLGRVGSVITDDDVICFDNGFVIAWRSGAVNIIISGMNCRLISKYVFQTMNFTFNRIYITCSYNPQNLPKPGVDLVSIDTYKYYVGSLCAGN